MTRTYELYGPNHDLGLNLNKRQITKRLAVLAMSLVKEVTITIEQENEDEQVFMVLKGEPRKILTALENPEKKRTCTDIVVVRDIHPVALAA